MNRQDYPFKFTGNAGEYFRIWIVNVLLTIVTLGIYSAWATVRNKRYFYSNTILDGSSFEFTAEPMTILRGRIVAVVVFALLQVAAFVSPMANIVAFGVLALFVPALIVMSLRFRMRYTSWRNIQFGFIPNFKFAYILFGIPVLMFLSFIGLSMLMETMLPAEDPNAAEQAEISQTFEPQPIEQPAASTDAVGPETGADPTAATEDEFAELGTWGAIVIGAFFAIMILAWLLFPLWQRYYYKFVANHTEYGKTPFRFIATGTEFYSIYMIAGLIMLGTLLLVGLLGAIFSFFGASGLGILFAIPAAIAFMYARAYITTQLSNTIYGNLELEEIGFRSELKTSTMAWIYVTNAIAVLLSLGLLIPWAQIRMAKYRASTMSVHAEDFDGFQARIGADVSAQGAEVSDIMDIDIGL